MLAAISSYSACLTIEGNRFLSCSKVQRSVFHAFVFHVLNPCSPGRADVIMRVFVKTTEAEDSLSFFFWAGGRDVEGQPFIAAADT